MDNNLKSDKDKLVLQSNIINALLPKFLKHFFYNLVFFGIIYVLYIILGGIYNWNYGLSPILIILGLTIFFSFSKISIDLTKIKGTYFIFKAYALEYRFKLVKEESHTINYSQITDIEIKKTIWDRMCKVGDLIIHTGAEATGRNQFKMIIKDIKNPENLKIQIMKRIHSLK